MTEKAVYIGHGLNLVPSKMLPLAHNLNLNANLLALPDHLSPKQLHKNSGHWQRWSDEADKWVLPMDDTSTVIGFSLSAILIMQALIRANKEVDKLVLISPAIFLKHRKIAKHISKPFPDSLPIPSVNLPNSSCTSWLPLSLYRDMWLHAYAPKIIPAKHAALWIHRYDELLDANKTIAWANGLGAQATLLRTPRVPLFHATYLPKRLPTADIKAFINSNT